jgi:type I restriction enzyme S subunit
VSDTKSDAKKSWLYHPKFPGHWKRQALYSLAQWVNGLTFREIQFSEVGLPVIKIAEIKGGISAQTKFTQQSFDESVRVKPGDMLFSWSGQPETSIDVFWWRGPEGWLNQHVFRVTPDTCIDRTFFYYLLRYLRPNFVAIARNKQTTGLGHVTKRDLENIQVAYPDRKEQRAIACILGTLDDKIELNRRRNRTLEAMARAIFHSWFVDFDPVKAKVAGKNPPGLKPELAALFPDRFEDSTLGPIPKGWRVGTVGDIVTLSRDAILPGDYADEVFDHYSIPAYDAGQNPAADSGSSIKSQKFIVTDDSVLVSKLNPKTPRVWIPEVDQSRRRIASTEFLVCRPKASSGLGRAYFYCLACDKTFSEHLTSRASGTSNSHQRVRPQDFLSYEIPLPAAKLASAFNDKVEPVLDRVLLVKNESRTLAALRDALLPKLISGELRVPDAERIVGRAT